MKLPTLDGLDIEDKRVIVRADLDLPSEALAKEGVSDDSLRTTDFSKDLRLKTLKPTINYLLEKQAGRIIILGHRGRPHFAEASRGEPEGREVPELSLEPFVDFFSKQFSTHVDFVPYHYLSKLHDGSLDKDVNKMILVENIRFWPEEEENKEEFARDFARVADCYVNEAFAVSHRKHASIVGIPRVIKDQSPESKGQRQVVAAGFRFVEEVEYLGKVSENPKKPVVVIISGKKKDKLKYVDGLLEKADKILIGGRLPEFLPEDLKHEKLIIARLMPDKDDITISSIEIFEQEVQKAGTIVVSGPIGKFEEEGHMQGTGRVFKTIAESSAFKVAGGGETEKAISMFKLRDQFDWISVGGGAMLEFLAKGTLPGIEALKN